MSNDKDELQRLPGNWDVPRAYAEAIKKSQGPRPAHERTRTGQCKPFWFEHWPVTITSDDYNEGGSNGNS